MDKQELIINLKSLLALIEELEVLQQNVKVAEANCFEVRNNYPFKKDAFDKEHKDSFITEKIGEKPVKPHGIVKLAVPVYIAKKNKYKTQAKNYDELYKLAEQLYYETFSDELTDLEQKDKAEQADAIIKADQYHKECLYNLEKCQNNISRNTLLDDSLKTKEIVTKLIDYLKIGRSDNLKEAINLYFDEKRKDDEQKKAEQHRNEMIELEKERVRAAQAAEMYQQMQYEELQRAADEAERAAEYARQAAENTNGI